MSESFEQHAKRMLNSIEHPNAKYTEADLITAQKRAFDYAWSDHDRYLTYDEEDKGRERDWLRFLEKENIPDRADMV